MFKNTYQSGFLSIMYSVGSHPLAIWDKSVKNGHIRRITDEDVRSLVIEIMGTNVVTTYITCPANPRQTLGIKLPFLVMIVKNMKKYFTFEIQILDDKDMHRRFRVSNFQSKTSVRPFCTTMPIGLSPGWNQIQFNLSDFTKRAYGTNYLETTRVQIHANVRIRRIYFSDRLYHEDEMPQEFKLYLPLSASKKKQQKDLNKKESKTAKNKVPGIAEKEPIVTGAVPPSTTETNIAAAETPQKDELTMNEGEVQLSEFGLTEDEAEILDNETEEDYKNVVPPASFAGDIEETDFEGIEFDELEVENEEGAPE